MNILFSKARKASSLKPLFNGLKRKHAWQARSSIKATPSATWISFLLGLSALNELKHYSKQAFCADESKVEEKEKATSEEEVAREEKISMMKKISTYEIGLSTDFKEGEIKEIRFPHEGRMLTILVSRVEGKLYATSAFDTYDDKTPLKDGVIFGDKLYSPIYGCAYSVKSGAVEYGPAIDNLAIFYIREKEGKVFVGIPKYPPRKVRPMTSFRDYNDLRKVVVIGSGIAAFACIDNLRQNGYTGEIKMITTDTRLPYDKTKLSKAFKNINYDDLYLRPEEYYDEQGIEFLLGREVKVVRNIHGSPHIELEDGLKIEYDALMVASGSRPEAREIEGLGHQNNVSFLRDIEDHKKIKEYLDKVKNVTIIGAGIVALETAATIRKEYPKVNVHVIEENEELAIDEKLGKDVADVLLDMHKKNGVKFTFAKSIEKFVGDEEKVKQIEFEDGIKVNTDLVLLFPNMKSGNTDYLFEGDNIDNLEFDEEDRLKVNYLQRSAHKRILGGGDATAGMYFAQSKRMACDNYYTAYHTGMIAAYNILALDIPNAVVPFTYTKQYDTHFNYSGYAAYFNDVHIEGDLKSLDFIAYYSFMGTVLAAFGSEKRKRDMLVINEAFRLDLMPNIDEIKRGAQNIETIEKEIRDSKRSGCFRDLINDIKYSPNPDEVVWMQREKSNEYHNFWEEGLKPAGVNAPPETSDDY